jgi:uncharacterized membrane protein YgdD (TMEM256/DUF423 family)
MKKRIIVTASVFGMLAVVAGAFGAHGLDGLLSTKNMEIWNTAVQYQFYHAFALLFLSTLVRYNFKLIKHCYVLFTAGTILFSGSLYLLACRLLLDWSWFPVLGPVTPIGGGLFIMGWLALLIMGLKASDKPSSRERREKE